MKVLIALTYFRPHVSGLTIYVERLARALAERGHQVTVLTSRYQRSLPRYESSEGVEVVRVPVVARVSKGVIMPTIGWEATWLVRSHDVVSLHLPQLDAAGIALRGRLMGRPTVLTYHSDLRLPRGLVNWTANAVVDSANRIAGALSDRVIAYTEDFATHSPFLSRYLDKLTVVRPPVEVAAATDSARQKVAAQVAGRRPVIGMAARLATEKGVEHLLGALPTILERHPEAVVLFAGPYQNVLGEEAYARRLQPLLEAHKDCWRFLGTLDSAEMTAFYEACDVTVLPSINNTETFGLVQIESMICGTPVVASNLPGVRQPVTTTGMGRIVPIGDQAALAQAVLDVLDAPEHFKKDARTIADAYAPESTAAGYEAVFQELLKSEKATVSDDRRSADTPST